MSKIYGYKESDLKLLAKMAKERGGKSLKWTFGEFSRITGKSKGTARNMYYALAKACDKDSLLQTEFMGETGFNVSVIEKFSLQEEKELIKKILIGESLGKSVRKTIIELSNGDLKVALRYQNKYRNCLKNKSELFALCERELIEEGLLSSSFATERAKKCLPQEVFSKLEREVEKLVNKIKMVAVKESKQLGERVKQLERENLLLKRQLFSCGKQKVINYLKSPEKKMIN